MQCFLFYHGKWWRNWHLLCFQSNHIVTIVWIWRNSENNIQVTPINGPSGALEGVLWNAEMIEIFRRVFGRRCWQMGTERNILRVAVWRSQIRLVFLPSDSDWLIICPEPEITHIPVSTPSWCHKETCMWVYMGWCLRNYITFHCSLIC